MCKTEHSWCPDCCGTTVQPGKVYRAQDTEWTQGAGNATVSYGQQCRARELVL